MSKIAWDRRDLRERRPWPTDLHFEDGETEKVIEQHLPPRPITHCYGCAGELCATSRFAEA
jgi:hypothetical protein